MTRVLVAFDKFKDALTARAACEAAARALRTNHPDWQLDLCPLTDGGEGFCETLTQAVRGRIETAAFSGPRGNQVIAPIGYIATDNLSSSVRSQLGLSTNSLLAVIEMAAASGLAQLSSDQRDPWQTSSDGTGEQILAAVKAGASAILLGVGGSATNDLGFGALSALGFQFLDGQGVPVERPSPSTWEKISHIKGRISLPPVFIACDVTNPLLGPTGATTIFGPQKGLRADDLPKLERQAARLAALLCENCSRPFTLSETAGAGAAGGFPFGLMVAADATLVPGFELVAGWLDLPARIACADLVLTGEGRFDATSLNGKGPGALLAMAQHAEKRAHVFAGRIGLAEAGHLHSITPADMPLTEALSRAAELLESSVRSAF
jgi:glycerate 2-kinase